MRLILIMKYFPKLQENCYETFAMISHYADFYTHYLKTLLKLIILENRVRLAVKSYWTF